MKKGYRYWAATAQRAAGDIIPSKETVALWLWQRPALLGWERPIYWLFHDSWRLCGIDSSGCLIVVDATIARGKSLPDPFSGLVAYARGCSGVEWATQALRMTWREYLRSYHYMADYLVPPIDKRGYVRNVDRALAEREATGNPAPIFFALSGSKESEFEYSESGLKNRLLLENLVGAAKVRLRVISGTLSSNGLLIQSWSPRARTTNRWERSLEVC